MTGQPHLTYTRRAQNWAVEQERYRHDQALYEVGEWAMFVLLWHVADYSLGLVERCSYCVLPFGDVGEVYKQPSVNKCEACYGTTFEGGYRARIVRPALFGDTDFDEKVDKRAVTNPDSVSLETTSDFRVRTHDIVMRGDGTRWTLKVPDRVNLRTGFHRPGHDFGIGHTLANVALQDPTHVSYTIPPDEATLKAILNAPIYDLEGMAEHEDIRGPLDQPSRQD